MRAIVTEEQRRSRAKGGSPFGAGRFCAASSVARQLRIPDTRLPRSLSPHKIARPECSLNQGRVSKGTTCSAVPQRQKSVPDNPRRGGRPISSSTR